MKTISGDHCCTLGLFSSNDARNAEQSLVRGGRTCEGPLNTVSQGLSEGTIGAAGI